MAMAKWRAGQAARAARVASKQASKFSWGLAWRAGSATGGIRYSSPVTSKKYTFNIGWKNITLSEDKLSKLSTASKNALMSKYKTWEATYNVDDTGLWVSAPTKTFAADANKLIKDAYNKAVLAWTGSEFLKTTGAKLAAQGYDVNKELWFGKWGIDKAIADANAPIVPQINTKITTNTPVLATNKSAVDMSRINTKNAQANFKAGNITQEQYNDVMTGKAGKWITPPTVADVNKSTEMQESTENNQQLDLWNFWKFGAEAAALNATNNTFIDTRNQKIIAGLGEMAKDQAAVKAYLESQPWFKAASLADQQNTINNIVQRAGGQVSADWTPMEWVWTTDIMNWPLETVNNIMDYAVDANERDLAENEAFKQDLLQNVVDPMRQYNQEVANNLDSVIWERFNAMNSNFQAVNNSIAELSNTANNLFDVNKMIARQNQAKQLADTGILTSEQAAWAASYSLQDYIMNVELQRAEIAKQMQEQVTTALKEKAAMEDTILQQKWINETVKQGMMQNLQSMYDNVLTKVNTNLQNANNKMDELIANANQTNIQVDLMSKWPLIQEKANQDLIGQKLQQANTNAGYRYQYVIDSLTNIAPTLVGKAAALMLKYQKNGTFMQWWANEFVWKLLNDLQSGNTSTQPHPENTNANLWYVIDSNNNYVIE